MKTANEHFPGESSERVNHLIHFYGWSSFEAKCYFFYESYDPTDWVTYE
jgi:hypothetical protein